MQTQKHHKIDLTVDYPCPCRRRGRLIPIALTEAFGCNRCQQIFVVHESGYMIEQLSTTYPYKKAWRWTGHQWSLSHSTLGRGYLPLALVILFVLVLLLLITTLQSPIALRVVAALVLAAMLVLLLWLACRR
ncbi:MAG: hypothetical protein ACFE0J_09160 [Elainellaceae cyanobacterium]